MKIWITIIFIHLILPVMKCQETKPLEENIIGKWQWTETRLFARGGGSVTTPESCSCTKMLEVSTDNRLKMYENGALVSQLSYEIDRITFMNDPVRYKMISDSLIGNIYIIGDQLSIGDLGSCAYVNKYVRIKDED